MRKYKIEDFKDVEYIFEKENKNNFMYYVYKYGLFFILGVLLNIIEITFTDYEFYVIIVPIAIFDAFRDIYFKI